MTSLGPIEISNYILNLIFCLDPCVKHKVHTFDEKVSCHCALILSKPIQQDTEIQINPTSFTSNSHMESRCENQMAHNLWKQSG